MAEALAHLSQLNGTLAAIEADIEHRERFKAFVLHDAQAWHREHLGRLYTHWETWNDEWYGSAMKPPYLMLAEPKAPRVYGDTASISAFGGRAQIRLRPSLLIGTHPHMRPEPEYAEGRFLFLADVLLHEMGHQYQFEVTGKREDAFHGHGPQFRDVCNRIGGALGFPPVRSAKKRGPDAHLPSCAQWPHNVRPPGYYLGASVPPQPEKKPADPPAADDLVKRLSEACYAVRQLYDQFLLYFGIMSPLPKGPGGGNPTAETIHAWLGREFSRLEALRPNLGDPTNRCAIDPEARTLRLLSMTPFGPKANVGQTEESLQTTPQFFVELRLGWREPDAARADVEAWVKDLDAWQARYTDEDAPSIDVPIDGDRDGGLLAEPRREGDDTVVTKEGGWTTYAPRSRPRSNAGCC